MSQRSKCVLPQIQLARLASTIQLKKMLMTWRIIFPVKDKSRAFQPHLEVSHGYQTWFKWMVGLEDWKTKKTPLSLSFLLGGRDPASDLHPEKPLDVFWRFYGFFRNQALVMPKRNPGFFFAIQFSAQGSYSAISSNMRRLHKTKSPLHPPFKEGNSWAHFFFVPPTGPTLITHLSKCSLPETFFIKLSCSHFKWSEWMIS